MKYALRLASILFVSAIALAACNQTNTVAENPAPSTPPTASASPEPPSTDPSNAPTAPSQLTQTYQQPDGAFQISLPENYKYEATDTGVIFQSTDEAFRGEVVFGPAEGEKYSNEQLEAFLKEAYKTNLSLTEVEWQQTEVQPDKSLRIDWVGKDPQGNVLDAESFIEQRGDTIYILTLSGINKPYLDYLADAQAIVGSYQVKQAEANPGASPEASPKTDS